MPKRSPAKKRVVRSKPECKFHKCIHLREPDDPEEHGFCLEVECMTHRSTWQQLTRELERALEIANNFPLDCFGGIATGEDAYPIPDDCILAHIPRHLPKPVVPICKCNCHNVDMEGEPCDVCSCRLDDRGPIVS